MANSDNIKNDAALVDVSQIKAINKVSFKQRMKAYKRKPLSLVLLILVGLAAALSAAALIFIIVYVLVRGVPNLTPELFSLEYNSDNVSCMPSIINTIVLTLVTLIISVPFGVGAAIYLAEYAKRGNKLVKVIRTMAETLAGIPSIVYGLFGMLFFVYALNWGYSLLAGAFTLAIMVLPTIMRTTEEALLTVPDSYREGSYGLGSGKLRTIMRIILPSAMPGILAGIILAVGRIVGETACTYLYLRFGNRLCGRPSQFGTITCRSYVCTYQRRTSYRSGMGYRSCTSCTCFCNQYTLGICCKETRKQQEVTGKDNYFTMDKFTIENMNLYYGKFHALKNVNIRMKKNRITAFIGPSGCGKSTLLKSLNRMNDLVEGCKITGDIRLDNEDIYGDMDVNILRKRVGMVFQKANPFPMSIYDNIAFGPRTHGIKSKKELDRIVEESLRDAAIWDELKDRLKKSALGLSGGQQQRLCIARALAVKPEVLLMDEATSALDPISTGKIEELCLKLKNDYTIVMVTHNMQQALRISDETAFFLLGEMVECNSTDAIFSNPQDKRTEEYITGRFG